MDFEVTDRYFTDTLKKALVQLKDEWDYIKDSEDEDWMEISDECRQDIQDLESIISHIKTIDDLAETDEETISFVYECLSCYIDSFIIDHTTEETKKQTEEEYSRLQSILDLFLDDDDYED